MTVQQMDMMTKEEIVAFEKKCDVFDENQSLEDYTTAIRDYIYLWRRIGESRKYYTIDRIEKDVESQPEQIKCFYIEKAPVTLR